jgi:hypothetical protein
LLAPVLRRFNNIMETTTTPSATQPGPRALLTFPLPGNTSPSPESPPPATPPPPPQQSLPARLSICTIHSLTPEEEIELQECERIIGSGWTNLAALGGALAQIRNKQLYKNTHRNIDEYCEERWGFSRSTFRRYIAAAEMHATLSSLPGVPLPRCEARLGAKRKSGL